MSTDHTNRQTHCPDCGQQYRTLEEMLPPASEPELREVSESEVVADFHRDLECPVQKEKDLVAYLEAALRHFGISGTLAKLSEIIRANEHDSEILWGDPERWLDTERRRGPERPFVCSQCGAHLGVFEDAGLRVGAALIHLDALEGGEEVRCGRCDKSFVLREVLTANVDGEPKAGDKDTWQEVIGANE